MSTLTPLNIKAMGKMHNMEVVVFLPKTKFTRRQLKLIGPARFYGKKVNGETDLIKTCLKAKAVLAAQSRTGKLSTRFFDSLPFLEFLSIYSTGYDWVDLGAARRNGVVVSYCPGYSTSAVAKWTISMIKKLCKPKGKILGIIGLGRIGLIVAEEAPKHGMKVIAWDRMRKKPFQVPLEELLQKSDVISIHLALNEETRYFMGTKEFGLLKDGVILINSAREALVDIKELERALESGRVAGAAMDLDIHSSTNLKKAITTPHIAWKSKESDTIGNEMFVQNLLEWRRGLPQKRLV